MNKEKLEEVLHRTEETLEKYGAAPTELDSKNRERFGERRIYACRGSYYRVGSAEIDGERFVVISRIDGAAFAGVGLMEDVEAFLPTAEEAEIERNVRGALELDAL